MKGFRSKPKHKGRDRRGVSDILANILILGMTVTLFSGVLAFVGTVPEPDDPVRVEMSANLDGDLLSIKHNGGSTLPEDEDYTRVKIEADGLTRFVPLSFGTQSPGGAQWSGQWAVGSTWYFNFTENDELFDEDGTYEPESVTVGVAYVDQTNIIWSATLRTDADNPPEIRSFKVEGENSGNGEIARGDMVTFTVRVTDIDDDLDTVVGNFNSLFKTGDYEEVAFGGGPEIWSVELGPVDADNSTKLVWITATDEMGNTDTETYQLKVFTPDAVTDPDDPTDPTEPSDPTVPGGGDPEESPPDFFQEDVPFDFFVYSYTDWEGFKSAVESGEDPPLLNEKRAFDVDDQFYLVFKIDITKAGNAHKEIQAAEVQYHDPKNPWNNVRATETGDDQFTNAVTLTDNQDRTIDYSEKEVTFTSAMAANGVKIATEITTGPGGAPQQIDWHGHVTLNENGSPSVVTSSSNDTADTLYFKPDDANVSINVFIDDAADKFPLHIESSVFEPANISMTKDEAKEQPANITGDDVSVTKGSGGNFVLQFSKAQIVNSLPLESGWNSVYIEIPRFTLAADDNNANPWSHYQFAHKIYIEVP